jgi:hypothetical protein
MGVEAGIPLTFQLRTIWAAAGITAAFTSSSDLN